MARDTAIDGANDAKPALDRPRYGRTVCVHDFRRVFASQLRRPCSSSTSLFSRKECAPEKFRKVRKIQMEKTSFTPAELRALRANLCWCELPVHTNANGISLNRVTPFPGIVLSVDAAERLAASDALMDCAMGALVGLAVADSIGHPLEFLPVAPESGQGRSSWNPGAFIDADGTGGYTQPFNKFDLEPRPVADDASMSLCLADSLRKCGRLDGSDVRLFFWSWWHCGLNNAFRNDRTRPTRNSVGLGGNISRSLFSMQAGQQPTPVYHGGTTTPGTAR